MYKIYLAGPIPISLYSSIKEYMEDMELSYQTYNNDFDMSKHWRNYLAISLRSEDYQILRPHIPGQYYTDNNDGKLKPQLVTNQDAWMIRNSDIVVADFIKYGEPGYECIGTLIELGIAYSEGKLIYSITHGNSILNDHPFIKNISAALFYNEDDVIQYLCSDIKHNLK